MSAGSPWTIVTSRSETRRTSASPIVTRLFTSDSIRTSRGAAVGPVSRDDHQTWVADPGDTAASTIVRPAADVRRSTSPGDTRKSDCSPGTSNVAVALPAGGTGRTKDPRPGLEVIAEPHSSVAENVEGPDRTATCELPSATSGSERLAMRASSSVALAIERYLHRSRLEHFTVHRHRRAHRASGDACDDDGAREGSGDRRAVRRTGLPRGEIEESIVVRPRERHRPGRSALLRGGRHGGEREADERRSNRRECLVDAHGSPLADALVSNVERRRL